jgi:hypothetical protein
MTPLTPRCAQRKSVDLCVGLPARRLGRSLAASESGRRPSEKRSGAERSLITFRYPPHKSVSCRFREPKRAARKLSRQQCTGAQKTALREPNYRLSGRPVRRRASPAIRRANLKKRSCKKSNNYVAPRRMSQQYNARPFGCLDRGRHSALPPLFFNIRKRASTTRTASAGFQPIAFTTSSPRSSSRAA